MSGGSPLPGSLAEPVRISLGEHAGSRAGPGLAVEETRTDPRDGLAAVAIAHPLSCADHADPADAADGDPARQVLVRRRVPGRSFA